MTKEDIALLAVRGFALVLLVGSAVEIVVGALHALELSYFFPWATETAYRTSYVCVEIFGKMLELAAAILLLRKSQRIAAWLLKTR